MAERQRGHQCHPSRRERDKCHLQNRVFQFRFWPAKGNQVPRHEENLIFKWRFVTNSEHALKIHNARAGTACNAWNETYALSYVPDKGRRVFGFCNGAPR